jgi:Restriction endonuclease
MPEDTHDTTTDEHTAPSYDYLQRRLQQMEPAEFEAFIADVWTYLGWDTRVVGDPGDRGIDVIAVDSEDKQLIQAKRYGPSTTVGSPEVQQYASLRLQEDNVKQVTIVTTGTFSRQARELAPELEVILINGEKLVEIVGTFWLVDRCCPVRGPTRYRCRRLPDRVRRTRAVHSTRRDRHERPLEYTQYRLRPVRVRLPRPPVRQR